MTGPGNVETDGIILPTAIETADRNVREREVPGQQQLVDGGVE
jgi:hypothetical protein